MVTLGNVQPMQGVADPLKRVDPQKLQASRKEVPAQLQQASQSVQMWKATESVQQQGHPGLPTKKGLEISEQSGIQNTSQKIPSSSSFQAEMRSNPAGITTTPEMGAKNQVMRDSGVAFRMPPSPRQDGVSVPPPAMQGGFPVPPPTIQGGFPIPPPTMQEGYPVPQPTKQGGFPLPPPTIQGGFPIPPPTMQGGFPVPQPTMHGGFPMPPSTFQAGFPVPPSSMRTGFHAPSPEMLPRGTVGSEVTDPYFVFIYLISLF